jgi:hypothetical protein
MQNYNFIVRKSCTPILEKYNLEFVEKSEHEFFLIGKGFALWIFVDPSDGIDVWYLSVDNENELKLYTLMYINKDRFTSEDRFHNEDINSFDGRVKASMEIFARGLMNRCHDILSGDKAWLLNYPSKGDNDYPRAKFLAPYFKKQGYSIKTE